MTENNKTLFSLEVLKTYLIDYFLLLGIVFATIIFINGQFPFDQVVYDLHNTFDLIFILFMYGLYYFRKKIPLKIKAALIIGVIFSGYVSDMYQNGLYSTIEIIVVMIPFLALLVYDIKWALFLFLLVFIAYITIALGYLSGAIGDEFTHPSQLVTYKWVNNGIVFAIVSIIIALLVNKLYQSLLEIINEQDKSYTILQVQDQELKQNIDEKKVLLQEIHHRVKNNLAVVSGLLELQSSIAPDDFSKSTLKLSTNRILSISKVHELLYQSDDVSRIELKQYIQELANIIIASFNKSNRDIQLELDININYLNINHGVPVGIILNELITNSLKHGFNREQESYKIKVSAVEDHQNFMITYEDNGEGVIDIDPDKKPGLGKTLIESLLSQIDAEYELDTDNKYRMAFSFPKEIN